MKEIGILFKAEMVLAILRKEDYKTQTRRLIQAPKWAADLSDQIGIYAGKAYINHRETGGRKEIPCPYGTAGDLLWGREAFLGWWNTADGSLSHVAAYRADGYELEPVEKWTPSLHMPKAASRLWLENKGARAERLQEITEEDALAEGILCTQNGYQVAKGWPIYDTAIAAYAAYIDHISGAGTWDSNPAVWRVTFEKTQAPSQYLREASV